jgi:hypothetical protein
MRRLTTLIIVAVNLTLFAGCSMVVDPNFQPPSRSQQTSPQQIAPSPTSISVSAVPVTETLTSTVIETPRVLSGEPSATCTTIIDDVFGSLPESCKSINENSACYVRSTVRVFPPAVNFDTPGDYAPITEFETIETQGEGVVLLLLHLVGEVNPIYLVAFGGPRLTAQDVGGLVAITGSGELLCQPIPPSLVVRTESGERGRLTINGIEIELD